MVRTKSSMALLFQVAKRIFANDDVPRARGRKTTTTPTPTFLDTKVLFLIQNYGGDRSVNPISIQHYGGDKGVNLIPVQNYDGALLQLTSLFSHLPRRQAMIGSTQTMIGSLDSSGLARPARENLDNYYHNIWSTYAVADYDETEFLPKFISVHTADKLCNT